MKDKIRISIYPYNDEMMSILEALSSCDQYVVQSIIVPPSWKINEVALKNRVGVKIEYDFPEGIKNSDALFIMDTACSDTYKNIIYENMKYALNERKKVICFQTLGEEELNDIQEETKNGAEFEYLARNKDNTKTFSHEIRTPVVYVLNLIGEIDSYGLEVEIANRFRENGYKTALISSSNNACLAGYLGLPDFIMDSSCAEQTIYRWNSFISHLEEEKAPDIIVVGVPGGVMKYSDNFPNNFGVFPYLMTEGVFPDYTILQVPYMTSTPQYYKQICENIKGKFGCDVDLLAMTDVELITEDLVNLWQMGYRVVEDAVVEEFLDDMQPFEYPILYSKKEKDMEKLFGLVLDRLGRYGEIEIV